MHPRPLRLPLLGGFLLALLLAVLLLATGRVGGTAGAPTPAQAACGGGLDVKDIQVVSRFSKNFALQYTKKMRIQVTRGERVRNWTAELYTFSGYLVGKSKPDKKLSKVETTKLKLKQSMQPGKYTLVVKGDVPGCNIEESYKVVKFRSCLGRLPIKPIDKPGGTAADYSGFVSLKVAPQPAFAPLRNIQGTLSSFDGVSYGDAELPRGSRKLIGEQFLDFELTRNLEPGRYTVYITGKAPQPRSCGDKSKTIKLRFE